jgi:predicted phage-related endonuclease
MLYSSEPQGSEGWLLARRGVITASRFKDARDKLKNGTPSKAAIGYAMDTAREIAGGTVPPKFQNSAMRFGSDQEQSARIEYEARTGRLVNEAGFITTDDRRFGVSVDGLVGDDGIVEIKTMVASETLFTAVASGDISAYVDQCNGAMWLLGKKWVDLVLWAPDMKDRGIDLTVHTIMRDDDKINELEADLLAFMKLVDHYVAMLPMKAAA